MAGSPADLWAEGPVQLTTKSFRVKKIAGKYPQITGAANAAAQPAINARLRQVADDFLKEAKKESATEGELAYRVTYNQGGIISVLFEMWTYNTGSAHPMSYKVGVTANYNTGQIYRLADLFRAGSPWRPELTRAIQEDFARRETKGELAILTPFTQLKPEADFYLDRDRLVVFFQLYEHTPYAYGFPEFTFPLAQLKDMLIPALTP